MPARRTQIIFLNRTAIQRRSFAREHTHSAGYTTIASLLTSTLSSSKKKQLHNPQFRTRAGQTATEDPRARGPAGDDPPLIAGSF